LDQPAPRRQLTAHRRAVVPPPGVAPSRGPNSTRPSPRCSSRSARVDPDMTAVGKGWEVLVMDTATAAGYQVRPYSGADVAAVLGLSNADRLRGQPEVTAAMLAEAVAGRSPVDGGWWEELSEVRVEVLTDPDGRVSGVVSYARRPT